jgi:hypothetical protein
MSTWRDVRESLTGRYIEISQEEMASKPHETAERLVAFIGKPEARQAVAELFRSKRVLSAFPDKSPGDYEYEINWSAAQQAHFIETCGEEMEVWGYEIDFESPGRSGAGPLLSGDQDSMLEELRRRDIRVAELEERNRELRERLTLFEQGRLMRFLRWLNGIWSRIVRKR